MYIDIGNLHLSNHFKCLTILQTCGPYLKYIYYNMYNILYSAPIKDSFLCGRCTQLFINY